jgi:tetratricopeptide (TPR) repeat protein
MSFINYLKSTGLVLAIAAIAQISFAQVTTEQRQQAAEFMKAQNWPKAVEAYEAIARAEPQNSVALLRLGIANHSMKAYEKAATAYESSEKISSNPVVTYNLACVYALLGQKEKAIAWLEKALVVGFRNKKQIETDEELSGIRATAEFKAFEKKLDQAIRPCEYDNNARAFDFWVGDWDVRTQQGQTAGTNLVEKAENGCVVIENWAGAFGGTGRSLNFYDKQISKWRQIWVDSSGNTVLFTGEFKDGAMRYATEQVGADGKKTWVKLTFTLLAPGKVRQHGERSEDGQTWSTTFDFVYTLKK